MIEPREAPRPADEAAASDPGAGKPAPASDPGAGKPAQPAPRYRAVTIGLGLALLLVVALVATAPSWTPFLPWHASVTASDDSRFAPIDRLVAERRHDREALAAADAAVRGLDRRVAAVETRPNTAPADVADLRDAVAKLSATNADLARRLAVTEQTAERLATRARSDSGLLLAVLSIRDAVSAGHPFAEEYDALLKQAPAPSDIASAAAPLADLAKTGVASLSVLARRLRKAAVTIAVAAPPEPGAGWSDAVLARLRGLVTIHRVDEAGNDVGRADGVAAAEQALADGDLAAAVAALDKLPGQPAETARAWLRSAKQRLAAEADVRRIEALLAARLAAGSGRPDAGAPR